MKETSKDNLPLINERIRARDLQVITNDGQNLGVISRTEALRLAQEAELDLVLIADTGNEGAPVAKIMDFGKASYEKKKKQTEAKKHQKVIQVKEIKISPKISEHDYQTKMKQGVGFLQAGKHLKVTLFFRGRENIVKEERGTELFDKIDKTLDEHGLLKDLAQERDAKSRNQWSRVYFLKNGKK